MSPLVTIIIPAYNASSFLNRSVSSALAQTYGNIEIVIVDDGSTDDTGAIADGLAALDQRVRVIHQENRGLAEARRSGIKASKGEYITHLDADDELLPDAVAFLYTKCKEQQLDIAYGSYMRIMVDEVYHVQHPVQDVLTGDEYLRYLFDRHCICASWGNLCRREVWSDDVFPPQGRVLPSEDVLINIRLSALVERVGFYNEPVLKYYYVPTSLSATNRLSSQENWETFFALIEENLQDRGQLDSMGRELLCMKLDRLAFFVFPLDTNCSWVNKAIHDHRYQLSRRYAVLQYLLNCPRLCHWCVVANRRLKKLLK